VAADEAATEDVVISETSTDEILSARTFRR